MVVEHDDYWLWRDEAREMAVYFLKEKEKEKRVHGVIKKEYLCGKKIHHF